MQSSQVRTYAEMASTPMPQQRTVYHPRVQPLSENTKEKLQAVIHLWKLRNYNEARGRQMYINLENEEERQRSRNYFRFRKGWDQWLSAINGSLQYFRGLPSGDYVMQVNGTAHEWI